MSHHDILSQLRKLDFPACAECAIKHLKANFLRETSNIPGLGGGLELEVISLVVEDYVFSQAKGKASRMPVAVVELHVLELIVTLYKDLATEGAADTSCFAMFQALFGRASADDVDRIHLLARLLSLAISVGCKLLLDSAAMWMQLQGVQTSCVQMVVESLMRDFTTSAPGDTTSQTRLAQLPDLSQHFACIFISGVTTMCKFPGPSTSAQSRPFYAQLLPMLTSWISADPHLCLVSLFKAHAAQSLQPQRPTLWTSPTKPNTQTPVPGLVRWATQGPTNNLACRQGKALSFTPTPAKENTVSEVRESDLDLLWSRLHLGILQTLTAFPLLPGAPQLEVMTLSDMTRLVDELVIISRQCDADTAAHARSAMETGLDRMVQVVQIALATGAFRCSLADLKKICMSLPETKLRRILENQHLSNLPPAMHNAS